MKPWPVVSFLLAVGLVICWATRPSGPVSDPSRDTHLDSAAAVHRADSVALSLADTTLARLARDSSVERLADSAAALGKRLDELDRLAARRAREKAAALHRSDSLMAVVDSMTQPLAPGVLDTITVSPEELASDSALSCESRYRERLRQLDMLSDALERCRTQKDTLQSVLIGVRDQLGNSSHFLATSDSLLRWERDRPRPCRVNLLVASVGCGKAMGGTAVLTSIFWLVVRR